VTADQVVKEIFAAGKPLLSQARLFDLYCGEGIPGGMKSLTYALTYQADDRTLTDKEIEKAHKKIEERLRRVLRAQIRGQEEGSRRCQQRRRFRLCSAGSGDAASIKLRRGTSPGRG